MNSFLLLTLIAVACLTVGFVLGQNHGSSQPATPKRVTGIGGIFFKCKDPEALKAWYSKHLGLNTDKWGSIFEWRQADDGVKKGFTQWSPFPANAKYFDKPLMINYRVENLPWLLEQLKAEGVQVVGKTQVETYGSFAHILDCEGNKVELWQPNDEVYDKTSAPARTK